MTVSASTLWMVIGLMGAGTFLLRFSFLGLIGNKPLPEWALRLLRYTPVAVIPGLMAPQIFLPVADAATPDPAKLLAAGVTLAVGYWTKSAIGAMAAGIGTLALALWLLP